MDYVIGSVAALVTGNVTPNRPRLLKRALTPTKHQPSPNVTPKSEFVEDRSIFLSPTMQKKKAIVKKSPKRIFQNPDLETTNNDEGNSSLTSPKADKVKKHLKDDLDNEIGANTSVIKSPKNKNKAKIESITPEDSNNAVSDHATDNSTSKKKRKKKDPVLDNNELSNTESNNIDTENTTPATKSMKKTKERRKSVLDEEDNKENDQKSESDKVTNTQTNETANIDNNKSRKKKNKKCKKKSNQQNIIDKSEPNITDETNTETVEINKKPNQKRKKSNAPVKEAGSDDTDDENDIKNKKSKITVNPNAITNKETDSEHESDDEIESENEEVNKKAFETDPAPDESSDEETEVKKNVKSQKVEKKEDSNENKEVNTEDDIKRTLFVGNVPFSTKCKKEIKKIFNKHGQIETIRIRTVPVKDGRYTPKLALIKNELHPARNTVNVYIKYASEESVEKALVENNTVLQENHLRVSRSSHTGAEHDPKCSIFVGNLPFAVEDEVLRSKFQNCGEIESVRIIRDKKTNAGKGFGYVNFASKDGVELALALTEEDLTIKNRIIRVKRCTQMTNKQKQSENSQGKKQFNNRQSNQGTRVQGGNQGFRKNQGGPRPGGRDDRVQGQRQFGNQGFRKNQGGPRSGGNDERVQGQRQFENQGFRKNQGGFRPGGNNERVQGQRQFGNQGFRKNQGGPRPGDKDEESGAYRRILHKRKNQEGPDGPPNKIQKNINQPNKEKKIRKEFVGMTAEKKKKRKFDKGQKQKKALSEILTK